MVVGEEAAVLPPPPQPMPPANIDNIMSGIGNTGTVKMNNHRKKLRQRFDIIKKLGQGTYGKVQLGINKETGQEVAIKTIKKCKIETEDDLVRIRREVQIMSSVQHPNIIHIYEVFENREKMVLVMEFAAGGELYDYLSERKVLTEDEARRVFRQIATAVYYCHKHKICHRDLKLENILLDEHGSAKIADFGLSNVFDDRRLLATYCGSPLYASPEIVKGTPYQGPEVDCWSLGVLLYTLVYGAMPFDGSNFKRLVKQISQGDYYEPKKASAASPLIREMLTVCPKRRATIETICSHWWVNEGYEESCLDLAEELANQTPVRLDVLLSLTPKEITADQLVVPTPGNVQESKSSDRVHKSHSVGSVIDLGNTEAERRIIDMVTAGGEAALMPSPTRTITPAESPAQSKRKLETTISTENATGAVKKKEKPIDTASPSKTSIPESMEVDPSPPEPQTIAQEKDLTNVEKICDELLEAPPTPAPPAAVSTKPTTTKKIIKKKIVKKTEETPKEDLSPKEISKSVATKDEIPIEKQEPRTDEKQTTPTSTEIPTPTKPTEKRKSRIFETAEKLQSTNQTPPSTSPDKTKKFGSSGVSSVGNFKKEFERKASLTGSNLSTEIPTPEKIILSQGIKIGGRKTSLDDSKSSSTPPPLAGGVENLLEKNNKLNDSKSSITSFSLEEARRSMENSIALLNQAKNESSKEVDQLCAKTENVSVSDMMDREKKLKNAREIIGNAIQPGRLCMGVRKPPVPFGINGRSISGSVIPSSTGFDKKPLRVQVGVGEPRDMTATYSVTSPEQKLYEQDPLRQRQIAVATLDESPELEDTTKTSRAEITLKSATLPRRKATKAEIKVDIEPKPERNSGMRFSTEMQHHIPDLRSAPIREHPYSPLTTPSRSNSLEPQAKEMVIPIQRPPTYNKASSASFRSGSLSRQSTNDSDTDTTQIQSSIGSTSTIGAGSNSQPIKKSPREFIIPISVEGGGYITPRAGSLEPSDSNTTATSFSSKLGRPARRMGSLLNEKDLDEDSPFQRLHRHTSLGKESDTDEPRFHTMHRLRSSRPIKRVVQDPNDSASSGDEDDEDGFEILTAENLFSTLLQRVRALTNRLNVNDTPGFPSSRLMSNFSRQSPDSFWNHDPFGSNLNKSSSSWRHSVSRDLGSDIDSMFSRSGATLPRGTKFKSTTNNTTQPPNNQDPTTPTTSNNTHEKLDLDDLDLSRLRLTKKDLETLSNLTPNLPKQVQEQLLAQLPPNQARKLSRTFSMQNNSTDPSSKPYKRSLSGGRELTDPTHIQNQIINKFTKPNTSLIGRTESIERNPIYRRSLSKGRYDNSEKTSRSSSRCRDSIGGDTDESTKSFLSDLAKYRSYRSDYENSNSASTMSPANEYYNNLPPISGCMSPPPLPNDLTQRRRSTSKRISRFLRPDFFDTPREESIYVSKENKDRDVDSRRLLREIRERSRERSTERYQASSDRLNYIMEKYSLKKDESDVNNRYIRHSSVDDRFDQRENSTTTTDFDRRRCSLSASKEHSLPPSTDVIKENSSFADKILNELQQIAKINKSEDSKKLNKTKSKEKIVDKSSDDISSSSIKSNNNIDKINDSNMVANFTKEIDSICPLNLTTATKSRESRLTRPKSYPNKSNDKLVKKSSDKIDVIVKEEKSVDNVKSEVSKTVPVIENNSKIMRPKSYPNSKLTPPKELSVAVIKSGDEKKEEDKKEKSPSVSATITLPAPTSTTTTTTVKIISKSKEKVANGDLPGTSTAATPATKPVKKIIKTVKKTIKVKDKTDAAATNSGTTDVKDSKIKSDDSVKEIKEDVADKKLKDKEKVVKEKDIEPEKDKIKEKSKEKELEKEIDKKEKEPSPEKKVGKGFLYSIGQKFEKFRENTKTKEKKNGTLTKDEKSLSTKEQSPPIATQPQTIITTTTTVVPTENNIDPEKKKKTKQSSVSNNDDKNIKIEKRSNKIDAMIRNLREKSVPRSPVITESRLLKRAVSVEDISGNYNKYGVNKVLGLFKKYEKDTTQNVSKIKNTKSTSNVESIENLMNERPLKKENATTKQSSSSQQRKLNPYTGAKSDTILTMTEQINRNNNKISTKIPKYGCNECSLENGNDIATKRHSTIDSHQNHLNENNEKEKLKNRRQGLMLDFTKLDNITSPANFNNIHANNNNISSNNNNNNYNLYHGMNDINRNTNHNNSEPSYENLANYSSDLRSPYDDCASTSTLFSPTDEPELFFDNWSVCSDDHTRPTSSPLLSKYSRNSNAITSPLQQDGGNESIVDRIRRKSFYSRFNEKKPKRVSTIVGPGATRDYYRESSASRAIKPVSSTKSLDYKRSFNDHTKNTHEYYRPIKTNTYDNVYDLSDSSNKHTSDYKSSKSGSTMSNYQLPTVNTRNTQLPTFDNDYNSKYSNNDYKKYDPSKRSSLYDSPGLPYSSNTYNPRATTITTPSSSSSSSYLNGTSNLETYATLGRKIRPYEQRSISLLNSLTPKSNNKLSNNQIRDPHVSSDFGSISRRRSTWLGQNHDIYNTDSNYPVYSFSTRPYY